MHSQFLILYCLFIDKTVFKLPMPIATELRPDWCEVDALKGSGSGSNLQTLTQVGSLLKVCLSSVDIVSASATAQVCHER